MYFGGRDRMNLLLTPPTMTEDEIVSKRRKVQRVEDEDDDEERINELLNSYAPLSTLPTPPLSIGASPRILASEMVPDGLQMAFKGPARHLSELIRSREKSVPAIRPDVVEKMLQRTNLDSQTVAFAACILFRLSWRFVRDWKNGLLSRRGLNAVQPEVIVLASLYVASSWLDDRPRSVRFWVQDAGKGTATTRDAFLATQFCILNDPSTNLMQIDSEEVQGMEEDLAMGGS